MIFLWSLLYFNKDHIGYSRSNSNKIENEIFISVTAREMTKFSKISKLFKYQKLSKTSEKNQIKCQLKILRSETSMNTKQATRTVVIDKVVSRSKKSVLVWLDFTTNGRYKVEFTGVSLVGAVQVCIYSYYCLDTLHNVSWTGVFSCHKVKKHFILKCKN